MDANTAKTLSKKAFLDLLGEKVIESLIDNNWVKFDCAWHYVDEQNFGKVDFEFEMNFMRKDSHDDTVIFCSIHYNAIDKKWWSENCIDYPYVMFDSFEEMKAHLISIEDRIIRNNFPTIEF